MQSLTRIRSVAVLGAFITALAAASTFAEPAIEVSHRAPNATAGIGTLFASPAKHPEQPPQMDQGLNLFAANHGGTVENLPAAILSAHAQAQSLPPSLDPSLNNTWREAGPKPLITLGPDSGIAELGIMTSTGRITTLAVDPTDKTGMKVWAGAAGGGVWYTSDGGEHWTPKFDAQPTLAVGALAIDPADPQIVYVGTGEANTAIDNNYGAGIFRTRDGGATWDHVAQNIENASAVSHIDIGGGRIFAATNKGLYRSVDRGDSWQNVRLATNAAGTAPEKHIFGNVVTDVRVRPDNPNEVTAVVGWRRGKADAPGNGLYRSTQGGAPGSFSKLDAPTFGRPGNSDDPIGRTSLTYAKDPTTGEFTTMWAVILDAGGFRGETFFGQSRSAVPNSFNGVYRSGDNGLTWTLKATSKTLASSPGSGLVGQGALLYEVGGQSWYNQWIGVDPNNPETVLVGLEEIYQTDANANGDGLAHWKTVGRYWNACLGINLSCEMPYGPYAGLTVHPDQHAYAFATTATGTRFYAGNDGGVFVQESMASGYDNANWLQTNDTLGATQPYYAVMSGDGTIYTGMQDNGTAKISPNFKSAVEVMGGDGFDVAVEPDNSDRAWEEYTFGSTAVTTDGGRTWSANGPSLTSPLFSTPFEMDATDKDHLVIAGRDIFETLKGVETVCDIDVDSDVNPLLGSCDWVKPFDLGQIDVGAPQGNVNFQTSALDLRGAAVYVGYCGVCDIVNQAAGDATKFHNGIATNVGQPGCTPAKASEDCWHKIDRPKGLPNRFITDIAVDPANTSTIYVTLANYSRRWILADPKIADAGYGHVFVSHNAGKSFSDLSTNLPDSPANAVTIRGDRLYVGTDMGVFTAPKSGGTWTRLGQGMPNAQTLDLNQNPQGTKLVAATHGRGVWVYDFAGASGPVKPVTPPTKVLGKKTQLPATGAENTAAVGLSLMLTAALLARRTGHA